ncbi:MAG: hypothetical protein A3J49_05485 [Gallionellales bacterium RIFCSPHIGHO2_02_FULL_57_16]|nr:MAG: hypothetical protein A3J49_05485 [Gallionellales bacterium RIFCSPHIGHO2_02_FULL_57_16]
MQWVREPLGEICRKGRGRIQTGPFGSQLHESDYSADGTPVVMPADISDGRVAVTRIARVPESHVERLKRHKLAKGDIVYGRRGDIGRQALVRDENIGWLCGTGCLKISLGDSPLISEFLHRYLSTKAVVSWIEGQAVGATMPNLNTGILERVPVFYPEDKTTQKKIAAILLAYDELIENNQRRIALLEKMAEEIYREWFVRLRFPGHEKVRFIKGVPDGWQVKKLGELVRTQYGYTASAETEGEGPKFLRITDIAAAAINWEFVPHCKIEEKDEEKYLLREGDIVVARTGATVGYAKRINKHIPKAVFASYLVRLIPKRKRDAIFLGLSVERNAFKDFIWMFVTGAAQPQANATTMALFPVFYPPETLLNEFNRIVEPILDEKELLLNQAAVLARTRDALLPRLISGKLSVENLDIKFPPSMEEAAHAA